MPKRSCKVGDKVTVVGFAPIRFAPGVRDETGTKKLFKSMVGKGYTVRGFDEYRTIELRPNKLNVVCMEPEFLRLRAGKKE